MSLRRVPYDERYAALIASWPKGPDELALWASRPDVRVDAALLQSWSTAPGVSAYVFVADEVPCAYAELWEDDEADEAELAHILVAPAHRRRGIAQALLAVLVEEARARGYEHVWLRVVPWNAPAIACYERAGFVRTTPEREVEFNRNQPHSYVWMHHERNSNKKLY